MTTRIIDLIIGAVVSVTLLIILPVGISLWAKMPTKSGDAVVQNDEKAFVDLNIYEEPEKPKPEEQKEVSEEEVTDQKSDNSAAALPEPVASMSIDSVSMDIKPTPPVPPKPNLTNFDIPSNQNRSAPKPNLTNFVDFDKLDKKPEVRVSITPNYPFEMKRQGIEGRVSVEFMVNADGTVQDPIVRSSTHREFEKPALDAIVKWKFRAGMKNGKNVSTRMLLPIGFKLDN